MNGKGVRRERGKQEEGIRVQQSSANTLPVSGGDKGYWAGAQSSETWRVQYTRSATYISRLMAVRMATASRWSQMQP